MLNTPYNFVPLHKKSLSPHWAGHVSHDVPFADGRSGTLRLRLTAHSPLFVKDGQSRQAEPLGEDGAQRYPHTFNQFNGRYFIPGSSLKGMIANVLEIISFGHMRSRVDDTRYALRDLSGKMKEKYQSQFLPQNIYCGWLERRGKSYWLTDCDKPGRISHKEIDEKFKTTDFDGYFKERTGSFNPRKDSEKAAMRKYKMAAGKDLTGIFEISHTDNAKRKIVGPGGLKGEQGTIVFTGQASPRKYYAEDKRWQHRYEFVFFDKGRKAVEVPEKVIRDFFFAYYEHDKANWSVDWKRRRKQLQNNERIPVFFQKEGNEIKHMGLSYLYKLPYNYSVHESIENYQYGSGPDLAQLIFGYSAGDENPLKGRVHVGHAFSDNAEPTDAPVTLVLAQPKASYFPSYIRQTPGAKNYKSFMDEDAVVAGWKRYPVHRGNSVKSNASPNPRISTSFTPVQEGARFDFDIHYHNLRDIELGALISAISFHGNTHLFHRLGMAKSLGYGKVSLDFVEDISLNEPLRAFESYMDAALGKTGAWSESEQIKALLAMAAEPDQETSDKLRYMPHVKDYVTVKNQSPISFLEPYGTDEQVVTSYTTDQSVAKNREMIEQESAWFRQVEAIDTRISNYREEVLSQLKLRLHELKMEARGKIDQAADARAAGERAKQAVDGPDISGVRANRQAIKRLEPILRKHGRNYHGLGEKAMLKKYAESGFMPEEHRPALLEKLNEIYSNLKAGDQAQWRHEPFEKNWTMQRISEWLGAEESKVFFDKLKKI
jgi:CRISPR-associated protein (TIGR03986 family)